MVAPTKTKNKYFVRFLIYIFKPVVFNEEESEAAGDFRTSRPAGRFKDGSNR